MRRCAGLPRPCRGTLRRRGEQLDQRALDADDDMVLEAAVNGGAEAIVTMNRRDFARAAETFGIDVLSPGEAAARLEPGS